MSQQKSLNAWFNVRKRAADQHATKRRKVILDDPEPSNSSLKSDIKKEDVQLREIAKVVVKKLVSAEKGDSSSSSTSSQLTIIKDDTSVEACTTPVVTSVFDSHILRPEFATPKSTTNTESKNFRQRKRNVHGESIDPAAQDKTDETVLFTVGKRPSTAKKRLDLTKETKKANDAKVVSFHKLGQLSPQKKVQPSSPAKNVTFEKLGSLSPTKIPVNVSNNDIADLKARASRLRRSLAGDNSDSSKLTPDQIKSKLGTVTKLSDLQAKLKSLNEKSAKFESPPSATHRRALFSTPSTEPQAPKLSQTAVTLDIIKAPVTKPPPSPLKASPRKSVTEATVVKNLPQPDARIPLPRKYKFLVEVFDILEKIVGMKHNRCEVIRVEDVKPLVQNVLRRTFNDEHLKQIRCVFPRAFHFFWEKKKDRMNRETSNFELHIEINHDYDKKEEKELEEKRKIWQKITPAAQVERLKVFKHNLLTIVQDHHKNFLHVKGINLTADVTSWHEDFDVESLPDIENVDFPPKPFVEVVKSAPEMIKRLETLFNPRLENVLQQRAANLTPTTDPTPVAAPHTADTQEVKPESNESKAEVKILKGLQGLSPAILAMIKAKEQARQIKKMTLTNEEQKELELMEELISVSSIIVNCHRSRRNGAAVPSETLFKVTSDSYGRKTPSEMEQLIRLFVRLVPECMEFKTYEKVEYIKLKKPALDNNQIRDKLQGLLKERKSTL